MITVYSSKTCSPCKQLKQYLKYKGFEFQDKDIEEQKNANIVRKLTGNGTVPVCIVGNHVVVGYNLQHLNRVLGIK